MPRTKGSKNKPKTVTADFATQIAEKQSAKEALTAEIASITWQCWKRRRQRQMRRLLKLLRRLKPKLC